MIKISVILFLILLIILYKGTLNNMIMKKIKKLNNILILFELNN